MYITYLYKNSLSNCKRNYIKYHKTTTLFMQHLKEICISSANWARKALEGPQLFLFFSFSILPCLQEVAFYWILHTDFALIALLLFNQPAKYLQCSNWSTRHHISPIASKFFLNIRRMVCSPFKWIINELFGSSDLLHASVLICWMPALF